MPSRRTYDKNFKTEAVKLSEEIGIRQASDSLGVHENTLRKWVKNTHERPENPFVGSGNKYISAADAEKAALKKEVRELKRANEILREALGFFAVSQKK